jgi:hypothetical protein
MVTSDQNIRYQQNLTGRKLALVVLGSNIWPVVRDHGAAVADKVDAAIRGSYEFVEMRLPPKRRKDAD